MKVFDYARIKNANDPIINGQIVVIRGRFNEAFIVEFVNPRPEGYNPAIVLVAACLEPYKINN